MRKWFTYGPFTFFDIETTGMSPLNDRIIEIAAIRYNIDGIIEKFHSLVNPKRPIPPKISGINKISDDMVNGMPTFNEVGKSFLSFTEKSTLVAHNAKFDLAFLQESFARESLGNWSGLTLDSIKIIRFAFPNLPSYSLPKLSEYFNIQSCNRTFHRAMDDVEVMSAIFAISLDKLTCGGKKEF